MNSYRFDDLHIGLEEEFEYEVTAERMESFQILTGDINPLHNNREFAAKYGFKSCVAYGLLSASLISTMGGCYLPGKYCLLQQIQSKFLLPVFIGDKLTVKGYVSGLNESVRQAVIKMEIRNQNGKKVVNARYSVGFLE